MLQIIKKLLCCWPLLLTGIIVIAGINPAFAAQSQNVVIIGGSTLDFNIPCGYDYTAANVCGYTAGGCLPLPSGINFSPMESANVTAANLTAYDTAVLNMASLALACEPDNLSAQAKTDLVAFVATGKKLIIYDSECSEGGAGLDYSWLPYPFTTNNPGAMGAPGTLTIVEDNPLSSNDPASPYFIDAQHLSTGTDAVGDMNVMTTLDPYWCVDMSGTNFNNVTGPVHTYATYPKNTDKGLIIYNGLDMDYATSGDTELTKIFKFEIQQQFNPSLLPCIVSPVGITIDPPNATNIVGQSHTVTASLNNLLGEPQEGIEVTFNITGDNAGATGSCNPADCRSDANGKVTFTYVGTKIGTDTITACFTNEAGDEICSQDSLKEWKTPPEIPVAVDIKPGSCPNPITLKDQGVMPFAIMGTTPGFDVTQIDPESIRITREGTLGEVKPIRWTIEDVATPFAGVLCDCHTLKGDGFVDLSMKVNAQDVVNILRLQEVVGSTIPLTITGNLKAEFGGTKITGKDCIRVLKK